MKNSGTVLQVAVQLAVVMLGLAVALPARAQSGAVDDISNTGLAAALSDALPASPQYYGHPSREQEQVLARQRPTISAQLPLKAKKPQTSPVATPRSTTVPASETQPVSPKAPHLSKIPTLSLNSPKASQRPAVSETVQKNNQVPAPAPAKIPATPGNGPNKPEHNSVVIFGPPSAISQSTPVMSPGITPLPSLASSSLSQPDRHSGSSLYDLVQTAIDHNAHIRLAAQNLRSANAGSLQAIGDFLPHLSFQEQSQMYVNTSGLPSASLVGSNIIATQGSIYSNYMSIMASLNLFEGGSGIENLSAAHQGVVVAREQILYQQNKAVLDLLVNFQQVQSLLQQEVILRKAISLAEEDLSLNEQKFRRGNESVLDLNKARVLLLQYQSQNDDLRRHLLKSQTELAALLGQRGAFALVREAGHETIPMPPEPGQNANNETEDTDIVNQLPAVQADLANMREARHHVASVRGSFLPDVNLQAGYNWLGTSSDGFGPAFNNVNRNNYTVGLSITQSLGPFTGHLAKLHDAEAKLESAHIQYQQAILEGHQQLRVDREEIQEGNRRVQALHEEYISTQKDQQLLSALYEHGRVSKMDVHTAELRTMNAQAAWRAAQGEWVVAQWLFYAMLHPHKLVHMLLEKTLNVVQESENTPEDHPL